MSAPRVSVPRAIRQIHRWGSMAFTLAAIGNIVAVLREVQAMWIGLVALVPLVVLLLTGLYLFALPYLPRRPAGEPT